ncbi:putative Zn-dependent protease and their inactivated-like protein [Archaeoglobus sulfaticallidus PM70-1]|uniref:Putative Zn-dependent protease and their inactivated-like protein n=1 Tax=Archaeoglobus sulfaticallidus PM70-1 TaxID=387631 RepID=N0BM41_9EURY|nr:TldD/PmbA family protein [Archaeoglobus sulfaticallidus]AGK61666.1 putative Zn-dependent protease and their inactivated-like protein [Archaeoglobus sulfaticallidus PM70-1]
MDEVDFRMNIEHAARYLDFNSDSWEIFHEIEYQKVLKIEKNRLSSLIDDVEEGIAVRVINDSKVGFAYTTDPDSIISACEMAVKISRVSEDRLSDFPEGGAAMVDGIFSEKVVETIKQPEWLYETGKRMTAIADEEKVNLTEGVIELSASKTRILNSTGTEVEKEETAVSVFVECVSESGSAYDVAYSRDLDLDVENVVRNSSLFSKQTDEKIDSGEYNVVFSPLAVHQLLNYALYPAFFADNVLKGRSMLKDKLGEKIFSDISIIDDGTADSLLMSSPFDDEGVESRRSYIIKDGVLEGFINDWKSSIELNGEPTGNGIRIERNSFPATSATNMILEIEEESEYDSAIYVHSLTGAHTSNPVSGDFSLQCSNLLFNGKPVKPVMISGNVYDLLKKAEYGGKEKIQVENTYTGWIEFSDVRIRS